MTGLDSAGLLWLAYRVTAASRKSRKGRGVEKGRVMHGPVGTAQAAEALGGVQSEPEVMEFGDESVDVFPCWEQLIA